MCRRFVIITVKVTVQKLYIFFCQIVKISVKNHITSYFTIADISLNSGDFALLSISYKMLSPLDITTPAAESLMADI